MADDNSSGNPPPVLIDVSTRGTGKVDDNKPYYAPIQGEAVDGWASKLTDVISAHENERTCEPLRSLVHAYLEDKGVEFVTGAYYPHGLRHQPEDEPKLQIDIWDVSDKMLTQVILPELKKIAQDNQKKDVVVGATGDNLTWDFVSIRLE